MWWIALIILLIIVRVIINVLKVVRAEEASEKAYKNALAQLKKDPANPDLRENALKLGREYRALVKGNTKKPVSELSIMNDINAACARASGATVLNLADELRKLARLADEGILTKNELTRAKARLIGRSPAQVDEMIKLLRQLHELWRGGVLSESEFNQKKWDLLSLRLKGES